MGGSANESGGDSEGMYVHSRQRGVPLKERVAISGFDPS